MVKRIIPGNMSPWECEINDVKYVYPPGTEQMVPDEVAHVIDAWYASQEPKYPEPVQPEGGGNSPIKPFPVRQNAKGEKVVLISDLEPYVVYVLETNQNNSGSTYFVTDMEMDTLIANLVETGDTFYFRPNNFEGVFQETGFIQGTIFTYSYRPGHITKQSDFDNYVTFKNGKSYTPSSDYHPANKKYVDDTVSQKISEIVIPEPIQGNWNQNDPTADDYIKNRTHWVEGGGNTLEWDGNTDGLPQFSMDGITVYKVSDVAVGPSDLIGGTVTVLGAGEFPITAEMVNSSEIAGIGVYIVLVGDTGVVVVFNSDLTSDGLVIEKGTYFLSMGAAAYTSKLTVVNDVFGKVTIHKIDPKFISVGGYGYDNSEVLFDQTVELAEIEEGVTAYIGTFPKLLENKTYKVTYNGVSYDCVPYDPGDFGFLLALGNAGPMGGNDTGEPFLMQVVDEDGDGVIDFMFVSLNGDTSATVKVEVKDLHTIDPKFLPGKVVYYWDGESMSVTDADGNVITAEQAGKEMFDVVIYDTAEEYYWIPYGCVDAVSHVTFNFLKWGESQTVYAGTVPK